MTHSPAIAPSQTRSPGQRLKMSQYIPFILFTVVTNAAAQIMLKKGMTGVGPLNLGGDETPLGLVFRVVFNPFVFLGLVVFVVSMASHLFVLSRVDVSFAYPFLSIAYVLVAVYAHLFLSEVLTWPHIAGIGLICLGTIFISLGPAATAS
jgi:drug/metabolite transporter (DMT)-like permease